MRVTSKLPNALSLFLRGSYHCWLSLLSWNCLYPWLLWHCFSGFPSISETIPSWTIRDFFSSLQHSIFGLSLPFLTSPCTIIFRPLCQCWHPNWSLAQNSLSFHIHSHNLLSDISLDSYSQLVQQTMVAVVSVCSTLFLTYPRPLLLPFSLGIPSSLHVVLMGSNYVSGRHIAWPGPVSIPPSTDTRCKEKAAPLLLAYCWQPSFPPSFKVLTISFEALDYSSRKSGNLSILPSYTPPN